VPEGDTLYRIAATLRPALVGRPLLDVRSPLETIAVGNLMGRVITRVDAIGKNLLIELDDGRILHTHLKMTGAWHLYPAGAPWHRPAHHSRVSLHVQGAVAVCFRAPVVRLLPAGARVRDAFLSKLGPDLLAEEFDVELAATRLLASAVREPHLSIADALLRQEVLCGIGNVFKSEALFVEAVYPFLSPGTLGADGCRRLAERARSLMRMNVAPGQPPVPWRSPAAPYRFGMRTTRPESRGGNGRTWVYGRRGEPCFRCGAPILLSRNGEHGRSTYYCPHCQRPAPFVPVVRRPEGD
jgi:endonuclease-8